MSQQDKFLETIPYGSLGIIALESSKDPVSYTHLDVYKRQG